jgi:hypothetical protein
MQNVITIGRELVPVEQIAYIEPFEPSPNGQFKPDKPYKGRVVLLNRETVLTETAPQEFAEAHGFRLLPEDTVATNPLILSGCEFRADPGLQPGQAIPDPADVARSGRQQPQQTAAHQARNRDRDRFARRDRTR